MRIAILEDDLAQAGLLERWLKQAGIESVLFSTGTSFRAAITSESVDLLMIDWMLPDDDGLAILVWLRDTVGSRVPVMFTTTRAEEEALVLALDKGADDYLIKPLRQAETLARVNALLRRGSVKPVSLVSLGGIQIDIDKHRASINGTQVELTDRELVLAVYMLRNHGRLLTRQELLENVWRTSPNIVTRTVDTHVSRLRAKLGLTPENGFNLTTVYHKGYRLEYQQQTNGESQSG
jgi:two-component system, OmpR family, response regulator RegX3